MLKSDSLIDVTIDRIKAGQWAQGALRETIAEHVRQFDAMGMLTYVNVPSILKIWGDVY
jgi:hypothetical protein